MYLPKELLLTDLLRYRLGNSVNSDRLGIQAWIHPSAHRVLGWVTNASISQSRYTVWRLNQLRGFSQRHVIVQGKGVEIDDIILKQLPGSINSKLVNISGKKLGIVADMIVKVATGEINHYIIARSNPKIPGSSRWLLSPTMIAKQSADQILIELESLQDLPLIRSSVRQNFIIKSHNWHMQMREVNNKAIKTFETLFQHSNLKDHYHNDSFSPETFSRKGKDHSNLNGLENQNNHDNTYTNQTTLRNPYENDDLWI